MPRSYADSATVADVLERRVLLEPVHRAAELVSARGDVAVCVRPFLRLVLVGVAQGRRGALVAGDDEDEEREDAVVLAAGGLGVGLAAGQLGVVPAACGLGVVPAAGGRGVVPAACGLGVVPASGGLGVVPAAGGLGVVPAAGQQHRRGARAAGPAVAPPPAKLSTQPWRCLFLSLFERMLEA